MMKFHFYTAFSLLFYGLYRIYAPFCYPCLSRTILLEKLKVLRIYYFTFRRINANKMNIYKRVYLASSIIVFIPLIFSPRISVSNCFICYGAQLQKHNVLSHLPARRLHVPFHLFYIGNLQYRFYSIYLFFLYLYIM